MRASVERYDRAVIEPLVVHPGEPARLAERDPRFDLGLDKTEGKARLEELRTRLGELQNRLFAEERHSVVLVLQGLDASGKDGVIRSVLQGVSPHGFRVTSFRVPTSTELAHDYLWRVHAALPARGEIAIFNRSHYEDIVAVRMLELAPEETWRRRAGHIREWERMLADEGTTLVKVFLDVSREEQRVRLQERIDDPEKQWKFRRDDLKVRARFDEYLAAWDEAITETSTAWAPWHVVPADRNWVKALATAALLVEALERIDPQLPAPEPGIAGLVVPP
jgi:PPK2 family polyphosphate:nucleotide phosphotransferase